MCKGILFITISHISPCLTHARNIRYLLYEMVESVLVSQSRKQKCLKKKKKLNRILVQKKIASVIIQYLIQNFCLIFFAFIYSACFLSAHSRRNPDSIKLFFLCPQMKTLLMGNSIKAVHLIDLALRVLTYSMTFFCSLTEFDSGILQFI